MLEQTQYVDQPDELRAGSEIEFITTTVTLRTGELERGAVLGKIDAGETGAGEFVLSASAATNGSEKPYAILLHDADASEAAQDVVVLLAGIVNEGALSFGAGHTADSVRWPLRELGIYLRTTVGA